MDLEMPSLDGIEAIRRLRAADPAVQVVVLTAFDTDERILGALRAGAQGYLLKGAPRAEIFAAIRARKSAAEPGPLPLEVGDILEIAGLPARLVAPHPGLPRLWLVRVESDLRRAMERAGMPIRYGYLEAPYPPLAAYQTLFAQEPGSAEMPSAGRPFTPRVADALRTRGVDLAEITLHTGVSSHEVEADEVEQQPLYAEPFQVPRRTADQVNAARREGRPVVAVGTTVVRALESARDGDRVRAAAGFTHLMIHPGRPVRTVDGLLTGLHDPLASHLALLYAVAPRELVRAGYEEAVREGYLWHEFGDSHLILPG
jgi:S-adenosylmethionine:tRNA ribosyltransferase-isomerase